MSRPDARRDAGTPGTPGLRTPPSPGSLALLSFSISKTFEREIEHRMVAAASRKRGGHHKEENGSGDGELMTKRQKMELAADELNQLDMAKIKSIMDSGAIFYRQYYLMSMVKLVRCHLIRLLN